MKADAENQEPAKDLLNTQEASQLTGLAPGTLEAERHRRTLGIKYLKVGRRVFYRRQDLEDFLASCQRDG